MNREVIELRSNEIIMESLHDVAMDLPPIERSKYVDLVTEALASSPEAQYKIISKLAKQVENLQQIDLEQCRKSMGNITKYPYYDVLVRAMEIINESEITTELPNVIRMNKIHNILLDNADDFIWGYKHNDDIVCRVYTLMTRLFFIVIDLSISDYIKALEIGFKYNMKFDPVPSKVSRVLNDADRMIKMFESGNWRALMSSCKKSATSRSMRALDEMRGTEPPKSMATEGIGDAILGAAKIVQNTDKDTNIGTVKTGVWDLIKGHKATAVITALIVIMLSYRHVAFYVAKAGGAFSNFVRHCADLIKAHDACNRNQSDSAVEKHNKLYNRMIGVADRIEAFFNKTSAAADKEIKDANRRDLTTAEITQIDGIDFGL